MSRKQSASPRADRMKKKRVTAREAQRIQIAKENAANQQPVPLPMAAPASMEEAEAMFKDLLLNIPAALRGRGLSTAIQENTG